MPLRYATAPSPIGTAVAALSERGLAALRFTDHEPEHVLDSLALAHRVPLERDDAALAAVFVQLEEYFDGTRRAFDVPLDLSATRGFVRRALESVLEIPYGETAGYGEVAIRAGAPGAARAVGSACARAPVSVILPVHRVVRADGSVGQYGGNAQVKRRLLDLEVQALSLEGVRSPRPAGASA